MTAMTLPEHCAPWIYAHDLDGYDVLMDGQPIHMVCPECARDWQAWIERGQEVTDARRFSVETSPRA